MLHHFSQESRRRLSCLLSTTRDIPRLCLLPAGSTLSAGTLCVEAGAGSFAPCTWPSSSWVVRNAEHRPDSRAWSFSKEFCQQKQNMKPAKRVPNTQLRGCSSPAPSIRCLAGKGSWLAAAASGGKELLVPESDAHWSSCGFNVWLVRVLTYIRFICDTWDLGFRQQETLHLESQSQKVSASQVLRLYAPPRNCADIRSQTLGHSQATIHKSQPSLQDTDCGRPRHTKSYSCRGCLAPRRGFWAPSPSFARLLKLLLLQGVEGNAAAASSGDRSLGSQPWSL